MKFATLALLGAVSAQDLLEPCETTADCGEGFEGCCQSMTVAGVGEESEWGAFQEAVFQG